MIEGWFTRTDFSGDRIALFFIAHDGQEHRWDADHWTALDGTPIRDRVFWNDGMTEQVPPPSGIPEPA